MVKDAKPPFTAEELREWLLAGRSAAYILTKTNIKPSTIKLEACVTAFEMVVAAAADVVARSKGKSSITGEPSSARPSQVNNVDNEPATTSPSPPPRPKVTDIFCPDFLEKAECSMHGSCGKSHTMCHEPACRRMVKLKDGSTATKLNVQADCSGWHLPIKYSELVKQREREKEERARKAAEKREHDDFKDKIQNVIRDIPGLNLTSKPTKGSNNSSFHAATGQSQCTTS